ncbi:hypothetical protein ABZS39_18745, partial [Micromonospora luteifusca]
RRGRPTRATHDGQRANLCRRAPAERLRRVGAVGTVAGTPTEGPGAAVLGRLLPLLPFTTVLVALVLPLAAVIYLVTTSTWSAIEQAVLRRPQAVPSPADR